MKKRILIGGVLLVVVIAAWLIWQQLTAMSEVSITDVRQPETLLLTDPEVDLPHAITIRGSGEIDGHATISLMYDGKPDRTEQLSGSVEFEWGGDWYDESAEVRYEPNDVQGGHVTLHYKFHD